MTSDSEVCSNCGHIKEEHIQGIAGCIHSKKDRGNFHGAKISSVSDWDCNCTKFVPKKNELLYKTYEDPNLEDTKKNENNQQNNLATTERNGLKTVANSGNEEKTEPPTPLPADNPELSESGSRIEEGSVDKKSGQ